MLSEVALVEGNGSIVVADATLSSKSNDWAVKLLSTASDGDATVAGSFAMRGGTLLYADRHGSLFSVSNCTGTITLSDVDVAALSGQLMTAAAGNWGTPGSNGGNAILNADNQLLVGVLSADALSTLQISLQKASLLTGWINPAGTAGKPISHSMPPRSTDPRFQSVLSLPSRFQRIWAHSPRDDCRQGSHVAPKPDNPWRSPLYSALRSFGK